MKVLVLLCMVFFGILMIPVVFGIFGAIIGVFAGIFGAIISVIAALFGGVISLITGIFGSIFGIFNFNHGDGWYFGHHFNIFALAAVALLIVVLAKSRRTGNKS
jgi:hypothetical protein